MIKHGKKGGHKGGRWCWPRVRASSEMEVAYWVLALVSDLLQHSGFRMGTGLLDVGNWDARDAVIHPAVILLISVS